MTNDAPIKKPNKKKTDICSFQMIVNVIYWNSMT